MQRTEEGIFPFPIGKREDNTPRLFKISPKSTHDWILQHHSAFDYDYREQLTQDVVKNAMEIEQGVNWDDVLNTASYWVEGGRKSGVGMDRGPGWRLDGTRALHNMVAGMVGAVAREMGLDMHAPQIVYVSVYALLKPLSQRLDALNRDREAIEDGSYRYPSEQAKAEKLAKVNSEAGKLGAFNKRVVESVEAYADTSLPQDKTYREVLQMLVRVHLSKSDLRARAVRRLKSGKVEEAHRILSDELSKYVRREL